MCDKWKHVSVSACIWTIAFAVFCLATLCVPFSSGYETKTVLTYTALRNGSFQSYVAPAVDGLVGIFNLSDGFARFIAFFFRNGAFFFYSIVITDLLFAIVLAIFRLRLMRKIFKGFSIAFGFFMILIALLFLAYIIGLISFHFHNDIFSNFIHFFLTSGLLPSLILCLLSFILAAKQFKWFSKPYKIFA